MPLPLPLRLPLLQNRSQILAALRQNLVDRGYWEVETPILGVCPGVDRHLEGFATDFIPDGGGSSRPLYLLTSPEYPMKRLLAAGSGPIFQITRAFRNGEISSRHNPEFTLAEWYRPGWTWLELMEELEGIVTSLARQFRRSGPPSLPFMRRSVTEGFALFGADPHALDRENLVTAVDRAGLPPLPGASAEELYDYLLGGAVEPSLPSEGGAYLCGYPVHHAALSRIQEGSPPIAQRFELFLGGLEVANGFTELTDAHEQRRRILQENLGRRGAGREPYPVDEEFLAALEEGMPESAGVAVGVDRLVMWLLDRAEISDVLTFPFR